LRGPQQTDIESRCIKGLKNQKISAVFCLTRNQAVPPQRLYKMSLIIDNQYYS